MRGLRPGNRGQRRFIALGRQHPRGNGSPDRANDRVGAEAAVARSRLPHRLRDGRVHLEAGRFYQAGDSDPLIGDPSPPGSPGTRRLSARTLSQPS